jgi:hypothetical protein
MVETIMKKIVPEKEPKYNINFESSARYKLPADKFDLPGWL